MKRVFITMAMLVAPSGAHAACAAANQYNFAYANQAAATLAYGQTYSYAAAASSGTTQPFTVTLAQNGLTSTVISSNQMPAIGTLVTGPDATKRDLVIGGIFGARTADIAGTSNVITVTFTFATPIRDFAITLHDIDYTLGQYRDWVMLTGSNGSATYTPVLTTPWGNGNGSGVARTGTGSSLASGATTTPVTLTTAQAAGVGASGNNSDDGTLTASFAQPVTSITLRYGNYPLQTGEVATGQQGLGIAGISFCPMPAVAVAKSSAPRAGTLGAFNLPASDVVYTLTVTNTGASPVDAGSIVLKDVLPPGVKFLNAAFDGTTTLPFKLTAGSSGVSLGASSIAYSNDGGVSWSYSPAAGYDGAVTAVRITPIGAMAANSSFNVAFAGSIK